MHLVVTKIWTLNIVESVFSDSDNDFGILLIIKLNGDSSSIRANGSLPDPNSDTTYETERTPKKCEAKLYE